MYRETIWEINMEYMPINYETVIFDSVLQVRIRYDIVFSLSNEF